MELKTLSIGESFKFVHTSNYRNLKVKSISESCAIIVGEVLDEGNWRPLASGYAIASSALVERCEANTTLTPVIKNRPIALAPGYIKGKRGKPKLNISISYPVGVEFTIPQLAELHKCSTTHILNMLFTKHKNDYVVAREEKQSNGRGRAKKYYKFINDININNG